MQRRIDGWGGDQAVLWASVKDVKQREGVVVRVHVVKDESNGVVKSEQLPQGDRKSTRLNSSHSGESRMPSSA